jgi:hypothetical protein
MSEQMFERPYEHFLHLIRLDGGTQVRVRISEEKVEEYAAAMRAGEVFPPVILFYDEALKCWWLADGFHRVAAAKKIGAKTIAAKVERGDRRAALLYAATQAENQKHGLGYSEEDRQNGAMQLLADPEWSKWGDREIGRLCRLSPTVVGKLRKKQTKSSVNRGQIAEGEPSGAEPQIKERKVKVTRGGKEYTMRVGNIGRRRGSATTATTPASSPPAPALPAELAAPAPAELPAAAASATTASPCPACGCTCGGRPRQS